MNDDQILSVFHLLMSSKAFQDSRQIENEAKSKVRYN